MHSFNSFLDEDPHLIIIMQRVFQIFDINHSGYIETLKIATILNSMGQIFDHKELSRLIRENDPDDSGQVDFDTFFKITLHFMDDDDAGSTQQELKEAFRLYDKEGNGYITTGTLREMLKALDEKLTGHELDGIIAEIDLDGSGTVDFNEFMEMMTGD